MKYLQTCVQVFDFVFHLFSVIIFQLANQISFHSRSWPLVSDFPFSYSLYIFHFICLKSSIQIILFKLDHWGGQYTFCHGLQGCVKVSLFVYILYDQSFIFIFSANSSSCRIELSFLTLLVLLVVWIQQRELKNKQQIH